LYAKEQKEAEDVTRKIFVRLDGAASPAGIVSLNKIAPVPRTSAIIVATSASSARAGASTGRLIGLSVFLVGHVSASDTREVDTCPAACDLEGATRAETLPRSAQIKHAVRVIRGL
jgi:hypothetical protein